ncbi:hypothetical protein [Pararhizobium sp.]|uniref:hypothetical protein n=1 Tax=Pararhizobium sp. TaxID=1977563 RepID=UPI0027277BC3|nr:hypothetical protein [Pararhizobium sp.]MDO9418702.1 hypothetical protein [Pararhizobium sp.]
MKPPFVQRTAVFSCRDSSIRTRKPRTPSQGRHGLPYTQGPFEKHIEDRTDPGRSTFPDWTTVSPAAGKQLARHPYRMVIETLTKDKFGHFPKKKFDFKKIRFGAFGIVNVWYTPAHLQRFPGSPFWRRFVASMLKKTPPSTPGNHLFRLEKIPIIRI